MSILLYSPANNLTMHTCRRLSFNLACLLGFIGSATATAAGSDWRNPYWLVAGDDRGVTDLRCDPAGSGRHGEPLIAAGGIAPADAGRGTVRISVEGPELRLELDSKNGPGSPLLNWCVPFTRAGYYDSDAHRLYPSPDSLESHPHRETYRKFIGGSGHVRFIEEFKRVEPAHPSSYGSGTTIAPLILGPKNLLLLCGDRELGFDLLVHWPGAERLECLVEDDRLTFRGPLAGRLLVRVEPSGRTQIPGGAFEMLGMKFTPDIALVQSLTGKRVGLNALVADFLSQGVNFHPGVITGGDWLHGAVTTHQLDDPRSPAVQRIRRALLEAANVGYDRCGHFGLMYCWGDSPNYGDGGFLAPSVDARHLHINWVFITSFARFALMTRDRSLLRAARQRWVALDDAPPILGGGAAIADPILVKGDWRLDFGLPTQHTLGQSFAAEKAFRSVRLALGNHAGTEAKLIARLLSDGPGGKELGVLRTTLAPRTHRTEVGIELSKPVQPGRYQIELADVESGRKWDGGLCWWTDPDARGRGDRAYNGPFSGDRWALLKQLFNYAYTRFGPEREGVASYAQRYGCGPNKSGRSGDPIVCVSYWEQFGGGKDMWSSLWYPPACSAMAELARWQGLNAESLHYDNLRRQADEAFRRTFGREVTENGSRHYRYVASVDWDGRSHDYGHAHYNLEAISRGIADEPSARRILNWLDQGSISRDGGKSWGPGIYDFWQIVPPFNTVNNTDWQGLGGQPGGFPFGEVLSAGGARLATVMPDLVARVRILGPDDAWKRALQVLDRYARPDRLTGGRIVSDPGGRGRWHFGPPQLDRADIEGFREIFPDNGAAATALPVAFLGLEPTAAGLRLVPRVPSSLDGFEVSGLGYGGAVWQVSVRAQRQREGEARLEVAIKRSFGPQDGWTVKSGGSVTPVSPGRPGGAVVTVRPGSSLVLDRAPTALEAQADDRRETASDH